MILVTYKDNWADEMDVRGFAILTDERWAEIKSKLEAHSDTLEFNVGSNEEISYDDGKDLLSVLIVVPISDAEAETLHKLFASFSKQENVTFGFFPWSVIEDMESSEDLDDAEDQGSTSENNAGLPF